MRCGLWPGVQCATKDVNEARVSAALVDMLDGVGRAAERGQWTAPMAMWKAIVTSPVALVIIICLELRQPLSLRNS